jgi:hypothetical protein
MQRGLPVTTFSAACCRRPQAKPARGVLVSRNKCFVQVPQVQESASSWMHACHFAVATRPRQTVLLRLHLTDAQQCNVTWLHLIGSAAVLPRPNCVCAQQQGHGEVSTEYSVQQAHPPPKPANKVESYTHAVQQASTTPHPPCKEEQVLPKHVRHAQAQY